MWLWFSVSAQYPDLKLLSPSEQLVTGGRYRTRSVNRWAPFSPGNPLQRSCVDGPIFVVFCSDRMGALHQSRSHMAVI